jgi:hypothetical protein
MSHANKGDHNTADKEDTLELLTTAMMLKPIMATMSIELVRK